MGFFSLPFGIRVSGADPVDAERYIKNTLEERNALFDEARTHVGLLCFVTDTLYLFEGPARDDWAAIGFSSDIGTTEEIVATVTGGDVDPGDIIPLGTALTEFIKQLLAPVLEATVQQGASASITNVPSQTIEIGTALNFAIAGELDRGLIDSKDAHPDVALVGTEDPGNRIYGGPGVDAVGDVSTVVVSGAQVWSLTIAYTADNLEPYYNSSGVVGTNLDAFRGPGSVGTASGTTTGSYKMWWDTGLTEGSTPTETVGVRAIAGPDGGSRWATTSGFSITVPLGYREISFYMPATMSLNTVVYSEYNADVTSTFASTAITVSDAGGASVPYTKYTQLIEAIAGYPEAATYIITLQ